VDIFDTLGETPQYAAQCKLKEKWKSLSGTKIRAEVEKAKKFPSKLDHYAILTTGKISGQAQLAIQAINQENRAGKLDATRHCGQCGKKWARDDAKYIGKIFYDFRRSACYEMRKAGSSPEDNVKVSGHKSLSMFKRYSDLFSEKEEQDRQREVLQKRAAWRAEQAKARQTASAPELSTAVQ
jgi:hypothetical protein